MGRRKPEEVFLCSASRLRAESCERSLACGRVRERNPWTRVKRMRALGSQGFLAPLEALADRIMIRIGWSL
jgi:hypothetical protein